MFGRDLRLPIDLIYGRPERLCCTTSEYLQDLSEKLEVIKDGCHSVCDTRVLYMRTSVTNAVTIMNHARGRASHTLWHARDGCFITTLARLQQCGTFPGNNVTFVHSAKCYINDKYYGNSQEKLVTRNEK